MCVTVGPARLTATVLYAAEAMKDGKYIHILGYQNQAQTWGPNAMVLPFPTAVEMGPDNIIDTSAFPSFMEDYREAVRPHYRGMTLSIDGPYKSMVSKGVQVFDSGDYTVVLTQNAGPDAIAAGLAQVPEAKRPVGGAEVYAAFAKLYPGEPLAICCWAGTIKPAPLLWFYEPKDPDTLRWPGLDAHNGKAPRAGKVAVDHSLVFGSLITPKGATAFARGTVVPDSLRGYVATEVLGDEVTGSRLNGDFVLSVAEAKIGHFGHVKRVFPGDQ